MHHIFQVLLYQAELFRHLTNADEAILFSFSIRLPRPPNDGGLAMTTIVLPTNTKRNCIVLCEILNALK
jgi:hypothetical protein